MVIQLIIQGHNGPLKVNITFKRWSYTWIWARMCSENILWKFLKGFQYQPISEWNWSLYLTAKSVWLEFHGHEGTLVPVSPYHILRSYSKVVFLVPLQSQMGYQRDGIHFMNSFHINTFLFRIWNANFFSKFVFQNSKCVYFL